MCTKYCQKYKIWGFNFAPSPKCVKYLCNYLWFYKFIQWWQLQRWPKSSQKTVLIRTFSSTMGGLGSRVSGVRCLGKSPKYNPVILFGIFPIWMKNDHDQYLPSEGDEDAERGCGDDDCGAKAGENEEETRFQNLTPLLRRGTAFHCLEVGHPWQKTRCSPTHPSESSFHPQKRHNDLTTN